MNKVTIEQKAKAYDNLIERLKDFHFQYRFSSFSDDIEENFPELKESEDERIRKAMIKYFTNGKEYLSLTPYSREDYIAWLEKQSEQKPVDKVEPKFKVGDIIRHKEQRCTCKITAVDTTTAEYGVSECSGTHLPFDFQDAWELVEQKPAKWSEEDESLRLRTIGALVTCKIGSPTKCVDEQINWLKSLKDRCTWKPDSSMLICLEYAIKHINKDGDKRILSKLLEQLKQL